MKATKAIAGLLSVLIVMPIWYFLLYRILTAINPGELVWFLFWVYVPVALFARVLSEIASADK